MTTETMVIEKTKDTGIVFFYCGNVAGYVPTEYATELERDYLARGGKVIHK